MTGLTNTRKASQGEMRLLQSNGLATKNTNPGERGFTLTESGRKIALEHRKSVVKAVREGKNVPDRVLSSYPDLNRKRLLGK